MAEDWQARASLPNHLGFASGWLVAAWAAELAPYWVRERLFRVSGALCLEHGQLIFWATRAARD